MAKLDEFKTDAGGFNAIVYRARRASQILKRLTPLWKKPAGAMLTRWSYGFLYTVTVHIMDI